MADKELILDVKTNIDDAAKDAKKLGDNLEDAGDKGKKGFKGITTAVKGVGTAIKAAGIGIIVGLLAKLMDVFRQNQKVLDFFNIAMESLSIAFNDLFRYIDNNIGTITGHLKALFTDPLNELYKLAQGVQTFFIDNLGGVVDFIGSLGKLMSTNPITNPKLFAKNLAAVGVAAVAAKKDIKNTFDEITSSVSDYTKGLIDNATAMVSLRKQSDLAKVQVQGLIEEYDRQAEKLRQVRDDESLTFEERIDANNRLGDVLKEQQEEMLKLVEIQIAAAQLDVDKNNNLENQIALQEALNEKKAVLAQVTGFESEQLTNNISLHKEQKQVAQDNADAQLEAFAQLAGALSALAGDNKELAIAAAIIDTYAGANKAFREGGTVGFVTGAAIIAQGLANVQKMMEQDVGTGSGGGVASQNSALAARRSAATPRTEISSGAFTLGGGIEPEPARAFVVSDDITDSQNKLANIRRRATI